MFEIPEGVKKVGDKAFWCRRELTGVRFPAGVTELGENAFGGCWKLERLDIPEGVTKIGDYTFGYCPRLTGITLPASLTEIGEKAFEDHRGKPSSMPRRAAVRSGTPRKPTSSFSRCEEERGLCMSEEELRELLLAEVYVGAFSGLGAMLLDEDRIRNAGAEELARDS